MNHVDIDSLLSGLSADPPKPERAWSPFQQAVFDGVRDPYQNLLIRAVAGSGKTTTIVEALNHAPGSSLFLAFNKAIADELQARVSSGEVRTLNSLGNSVLRQHRWGLELVKNKTQLILKKRMNAEDFKEHGYSLSRLIGLAKNVAVGIAQPPMVSDFVALMDSYQYDIPANLQEDFGYICMETLMEALRDEKTFDYDDQVYLPILMGWEFPRFSNVFVDEAQDLSPIQHLMLRRLADQGARIVAVGDPAQAIYSFRGALANSMDTLQLAFDMKQLPLSISYRCPRLVVEEAQKYCEYIQAREGAPDGSVIDMMKPSDDEEPGEYPVDPHLFTAYDMIMCRNNAPLFRAILRHVRERVPCRVRSSFLDSFQGLIKSFKATFTSDLIVKVDLWFETEYAAAKAKGARGKMAVLKDKRDTIVLLAQDYTRVVDLLDMVYRLGQSTSGPIFATIHKAKGLEEDRCYLLRPDLIPAVYARGEEALVQEYNMLYVAITRARKSLTFGVTQ